MIQNGEIVVTDDNLDQHILNDGLVARPLDMYPVGGYASSVTFDAVKDKIPLIPWSDMPDLIREKVAKKTQISDLRATGMPDGSKVPNFHQLNSNFCWCYSAVHGMMLNRVMSGMPFVRFSPHALACKIKGFANVGGWSAHAAEVLSERGCPTVAKWPHASFSRQYDNAETWKEAQLYRSVEGFIDLDAPIYDRNLTKQQTLTLMIWGIPCPIDVMSMGHAMCGMDAVDAFPSKSASDPDRYGIRVLDSYPNDVRVLTGRSARPDNACGMRCPIF